MSNNVDVPVVSVFGGSEGRESQEPYEYARAVGRVLAQLGYTVANGGYGGTMEASARGAKEAGGSTIGVTCSRWKSQVNPWIDRSIETADLFERLRTLIDIGSSGYVVLSGATGTLAEMALVWELMCKGFLPRRPIVCMGDFWRPLVEMMSHQKPRALEFVSLVQSPSELARHFASAAPVARKLGKP